MPTKIKECTKQHLFDVALPNQTSTYTVISHKSVIDLSIECLENAGFKVNQEHYRCTGNGNIAQGVYRLTFMDDPELSMMFAWSNSYNKQMRFKCGIGAYINQTGSSMVCGDMGSWARKHTGTADTETEETIKEQIKDANMYYKQLVKDKESMKEIHISKRQQAQLLGILFAEYEILTTEQASIIRQQMSRPSFKYGNPDSLWAFYNHVTIALQQSHPKTWMEDQRVLHWFISDAFKFNKVEEVEPEVDPNQVDLEDMIAEVEAEEETTVQELVDKAVANPNDDTGEEIVETTPELAIEEQIAEDEAEAEEGFTVHLGDEEGTSYEIKSVEDMESLQKHAKEVLKHQEDDADFDLDFTTETEQEEIDVEDGDLPDLF
tara:strand:+ start:4502 stop:5632 length:1131 start_codon:yes stop_codon:yes gene_type:complete